jgi:hypothetical protein
MPGQLFVSKYADLWTHFDHDIDVMLCTGSSLSYCDSWSASRVAVSRDNDGVVEALRALEKCIRPDGVLIIGNGKCYKKTRSQDLIEYAPLLVGDDIVNVNWLLTYDWHNLIKHWTATVTRTNGGVDCIQMESHLFDSEMLVNMCREVFSHVEILETPKELAEYFVLCSHQHIRVRDLIDAAATFC